VPKYNNDTPAASTAEYSPEADSTPGLEYQSGGDTMRYCRTVPKLGVRAQLLILVCPSCKAVAAMQFRERE